MKKINNKGYLLVEIIVAFTLAMAVAYFLAEITISLKNKEEDLNKKVAYNTDRALITKEIMDDSNKYRISNVNIVDNHTVKLTFDGLGDKVLSYNSSSKTITYGDLVVKLDDTLTEIGNFEVKKVDNDTFLTIKLSAKSLVGNNEVYVDKNTVVSMNMFGFTPKIFDLFEDNFKEFLNNIDTTNEYLVPIEINKYIKKNLINVSVINTTSMWYGITYKDDLKLIRDEINRLINDGVYPNDLWK